MTVNRSLGELPEMNTNSFTSLVPNQSFLCGHLRYIGHLDFFINFQLFFFAISTGFGWNTSIR